MKASLIPALLTASLAGLLPAPSRAESVSVQWEKVYNGPGNDWDEPNAVAVDSAGNVIVTGRSIGTLRYNNSDDSDYYTAKYAAADGVLIWERRYDGPFNRNDFATAVALDGDGNAIVTGHSVPITNGIRWPDYYTAKYASADGGLLWERRYNGPANGDDGAYALAVDGTGNVIVTGSSSGDYYTAKYAAANGALLWEKRYNGPANSNDVPWGLAVDSAGNAIVTGYSYAIGDNNADFYTAKYAATNGALVWERRYNGPANGFDGAEDVTVDKEGNAIVTGLSIAAGGEADFYTAKYAAANGSLLWEKRYNGTENSDDRATAVQVDSAGNVFVTGSSYSGGKSDFYTAKYATANGVLLWEKRYNGTANGRDAAKNLAVDREGNAIVTGISDGEGGNSDRSTVKYAAANGALLWERRDGPFFRQTFSSGKLLALTPDGGAVITGGSGSQQFAQDFFTIEYAPVDVDLDDDGLLDSWETSHFGGTTGQSAFDDTDGDGVVELLELAFGTDPQSPISVPAPAVVVEVGYLTTAIAKQPGVSYLVQTSATPGTGFSGTSTTVLTDTTSTLKVRDNVPLGTQSTRFLRVQVTAAP